MPWSRYVLIVLTAVNGLLAFQTLNTFSAQTAPGIAYPPLLRVMSAVLWTGLFAWLTVGMFRRSARILRFIAPILSVYGLWAFLSLLAFARADFDRGRVLFQAVFTLIALIPFWWWHVRVLTRSSATTPS